MTRQMMTVPTVIKKRDKMVTKEVSYIRFLDICRVLWYCRIKCQTGMTFYLVNLKISLRKGDKGDYGF
jgi:hypothetical protein